MSFYFQFAPNAINVFRLSQEAGDKPDTLVAAITPELLLRLAGADPAPIDSQPFTTLGDNDRRISELESLLSRIGDLAHDRSTGPAVEDGYWEIREMAYTGVGIAANTEQPR